MATCTACGEENSEGARFCQACGAVLQDAHTDESRRTVTVIFSDVVGSTALAEQLDTETFSMVMGLYFERMSRVADRHGGTVAKFIGDAIVVVFGVPALHEDDALRAVKTAWEMRDALDGLNEELKRRWDITLASKTGINSGEVLTTTTQWGHDGVGRAVADRGGHVAIGDAMNVGARLEQAAGAGEIILGESTYRLVRGAVEAERLPPMVLKGKAERSAAYRLLRVATDTEPLARHLDSPMVGRRDDLATLEWAFGRTARTQGCRVVTILGPAGVGKTRLAQEFVEQISDSAIVLQGRCLSYGEGITFWPIAEMVRSAAGISDPDTQEEATAKIAALLSGDRDAIEAAGGVSQAIGFTTDESAPRDTFWSLRRFMAGLARARPLILVFEDIHWAERTLLDLIESIAEWTLDVPILIVCTARPELLDDRPDWNDPKRYEATRIVLAPLAEGEAERLVRNLVGDGDLDASTTDAIVEASGGNPLFMEQMVSMLVDEGALKNADLSAGSGATEIVIPPTIQALIAARLDRLDPVERRVLGTASVVGRVFYRDAVSVLSNGEGAALGSSLMTLIRRQLIEPSASDIGGQDAYRFSHALVRDAAYEGVPKHRRAILHAELARWLEAAAGDRIPEYEEILAYHLEQAYRYYVGLRTRDDEAGELATAAADHLGAVGRRALARGDAHAAANLLARALSLLPAADRRQPDLLLALATALGETGALDREREVLEQAKGLADALQDRGMQAHVWLAFARHHATADPRASVEDAARAAARAMRTFEELGDDRGLASAWRLTHWVAHQRYRHAESLQGLVRAHEFALRAGDPSAVGDLSAMSAAMLYGPTPVKEAIRRSETILDDVKGSRSDESFVLGFLGIMHAMDGRPAEGRELIARAGVIARDFGLRLTSTATRSYWLGMLESLSGNDAAAEKELRAGYEVLKDMGEMNFASTLAARLAETLCTRGRYGEAEKFADISSEVAGAEDIASQVIWRGAKARVLASRGDHEHAQALAREAVDLTRGTDALNTRADVLVDLAEVERAAGQDEGANRSIRRAVRLYRRKGNIASVDRCLALLSRVRS